MGQEVAGIEGKASLFPKFMPDVQDEVGRFGVFGTEIVAGHAGSAAF